MRLKILNKVDNDRIVYLAEPTIDEPSIKSVQEALAEGFVSGAGRYTGPLEQKLGKLVGADVLVCSSGTSALKSIIQTLNLEKNSTVLVPSVTFCATVRPFLDAGLRVRFLDAGLNGNVAIQKLSDFKDYGLIVENNRLINETTKQKVACICVTDVFGTLNDERLLEEILELDVKLVIDSAESFGRFYSEAIYNHKNSIVYWSFNGNKIVTSGTGGAVCFGDANLQKSARLFINQGKLSSHHLVYRKSGDNLRMADINAALLIGQLTSLTSRVEFRSKIFELYQEHLADLLMFHDENKTNRWLSWCAIPQKYNFTEALKIRLKLLKNSML